ncbi:hypothetical protein L226DRAFT_563303 [Lentinus tigrinus ALCF2SS1-7]|uniref:Vacuolar sorting protein 39/Transforming growth factor beta receptor-associated domain-containing protein n=1 Tax=Lentinus tigrinus ALCF2SS1-6 TaxID=1328759 RepID=A0A5C2S947_9APHY|nr:hypothetical protein L227DRAFT_547754 [Lentinus tigrinus ALCF2SS1-6]RPD69510.1 hypothetical protein L226DRAFT_563303 [Lentinus tigrinus ALCF2SS1-7]
MATLQYPNFPRANVLVYGSNAVQALLPSTLISQADALLLAHRLEEAADLAEQQRKKLQSTLNVDRHELDELRYVNQRLGFQCFTETLFEDAGNRLYEGDLDPRVLVSYYPELRGDLFTEDDTVDVMAGVAEHMPQEDSVDDIIAQNLVMNYSPHLSPNTREAPATVELRNVLSMTARDMLESYLRKWRRKLAVEAATPHVDTMRMVVDTVLAKLHVAAGKLPDLSALIDQPNSVVVSELEPVLVKSRHIGILCKLYERHSDDEKLLDAWSKLVDGEWEDPEVKDPLTRIFDLLSDRKDRTLIQRWTAWLVKKDADRALKLLLSTLSSKRKAEDDRLLLQQIRDASPAAGEQLLEHLVVQRRSQDPELHSQLALAYADQLLSCLADESTSKLWRAKASSYSSSRSDTSFISYFASTTPDSQSKRVRLKTVLFLQGSTLYDPEAVRTRLSPHAKILRLESAILEGKLGNHRAALSILVHDMNDATSAEAYCTLGGEVVPAKTAQQIGERSGLQPWASLVTPLAAPGKPVKAGAAPMKRQKTVDDEVKKDLVMILLEVYMSGGEATADRTAQLLNSQAMNLDVVDVISTIPPAWPLRILSTFVTRSLRRTLHAHHEGQIVKAISQGQNLVVADQTWAVIREQGAIVEEPLDDGTDDDEGEKLGLELGERVQGAPASFNEKANLHQVHFTDSGEDAEGDGGVVDITVGSHPDEGLDVRT